MACCSRMGREKRVGGGWSTSWRGVSQEVGGEAGLEQPCKVRTGRNLEDNHRVPGWGGGLGVINMFQLWYSQNKILDR